MSYPGGKGGSGVYQTLINLMPKHRSYVEAFLGGGAILRHKKPAHLNFGIDIDPSVVARWKAPAGIRPSVIVADAIVWLGKDFFPGDDTLVYCDPPYPRSTRASEKRLYNHQMTDRQHLELLSLIRTLPCMVMISSYPNAMYAQALEGWSTRTFEAMTRSGKRATEQVWFNYQAPGELHDYSFAGSNYRERERIKRKIRRWTERLQRMEPLDRAAVSAAIDACGVDPTPPKLLKAVLDLPTEPRRIRKAIEHPYL